MGWFGSNKREQEVSKDVLIKEIPEIQSPKPIVTQDFPTISSVERENPLGITPGDKKDPFFVRIDKFNEAKKNLTEIELKLRDMENILAKIGDVKQKEDHEIESWKKDMGTIRGHLESINQSVFSKL